MLLTCPAEEAAVMAERLTEATGDGFGTASDTRAARQVFDSGGQGARIWTGRGPGGCWRT